MNRVNLFCVRLKERSSFHMHMYFHRNTWLSLQTNCALKFLSRLSNVSLNFTHESSNDLKLAEFLTPCKLFGKEVRNFPLYALQVHSSFVSIFIHEYKVCKSETVELILLQVHHIVPCKYYICLSYTIQWNEPLKLHKVSVLWSIGSITKGKPVNFSTAKILNIHTSA